MKEKLQDIKNLLSPTDGLAFLAIVIGVVIALFLQETPIKIIGGSVALLGLLAVFISLNQKLKVYEIMKKRRTPQVSHQTAFTTTIKKDTTSKRLIFEDYDTSFGSESEYLDEKEEEIETVKTAVKEPTESKPVEAAKAPAIKIDENKKVEEKIIEKTAETLDDAQPLHFQTIKKAADHDSGFRIIEKKSSEPIAEIKAEISEIKEEAKQEEIFANVEIKPEINENKTLVKKDFIDIKVKEETRQTRKTQLDVNIADFIADIPSQGFEPRKEFDYLLNRALMVIRSAMSARTVCYFWVNQEKGELVLESHLTDMPEKFVKNRAKFPLAHDIISQIAINAKPEILTEINPSAELDLIPYYLQSAKTASFLGVPVFYNGSVIGVLCADTELYDAYDAVTVGFFGQFTKLIGGLTHSYIEKYDLYQASRTLDAVETLRTLLNSSDIDNQLIASAIVESASKVVEYYSIGVCMFDEVKNKWTLQALKSNHPDLEHIVGETVSLNSSLLGATIMSGQPNYLCPLSENELKYSANEPKIQGGYFISAPLKTASNNYGALFIEGISPTSVMQNDLDILSALGEHAGATIERFVYLSMLRESALYYDENANVLNQKAFITRFNEEIARSKDFNIPLSVALFRIDQYQSFGSSENSNIRTNINEHILNKIRHFLQDYHIIGNISSDLFAVALVGFKSQQTLLWSERIRSEIAISPLKIGSKQFNVTVSIGAAEYANGDDLNKLFEKSGKALEIASSKTNSVNVFS